MVSPRFFNGKVLIVSGKVAMAESCCCYEIVPTEDQANCNTTITTTNITGGDPWCTAAEPGPVITIQDANAVDLTVNGVTSAAPYIGGATCRGNLPGCNDANATWSLMKNFTVSCLWETALGVVPFCSDRAGKTHAIVFQARIAQVLGKVVWQVIIRSVNTDDFVPLGDIYVYYKTGPLPIVNNVYVTRGSHTLSKFKECYFDNIVWNQKLCHFPATVSLDVT